MTEEKKLTPEQANAYVEQTKDSPPEPRDEKLFVVFCGSGFDNIGRARSALMFATLAAVAECHTICFCYQDGIDILLRGAIEERDHPQPGVPTLSQRLQEARSAGVELLCCTQTMANRNISEEDLVEGVKPAGAMTLIDLTIRAVGTLSF